MKPRRALSAYRRAVVAALVAGVFATGLLLAACAPPKPSGPVSGPGLPADTIDPAAWQPKYPQEYADWKATADTRPPGSKYKKGGEAGSHDRLSEYPYLAALAKGFGFAVEFNEPRGHALAFTDQHAIDPARLKAGGVCLACKTPYYQTLRDQQGDKLLSMPYQDAVNLIPAKFRDLGVSCADCHEPTNNSLRYFDLMKSALATIGAGVPNDIQMRNVVCGQCHSTYVIPKQNGQAVGLFMPWKGGTYGDISVETIIKNIEGNPHNLEWVQGVTGLKLGYIRHPEFEFYTRGDAHYVNNVTCVDCHQPYKIVGAAKVSDHNVMSPLSNGMNACKPCHPAMSEQQLRDAVFHVQDNYIGALLNAGYSTVANAQLIRMVNESKIDTNSATDSADYTQAVEMYKQAFYRVTYGSGENSLGFHNPAEGERILADALAFSARSDQLLRRVLARHQISPPAEVTLYLLSYLENRGVKQLNFDPKQEFKDPRGIAEILWKNNLAWLRSGVATPTTGSNAEAVPPPTSEGAKKSGTTGSTQKPSTGTSGTKPATTTTSP